MGIFSAAAKFFSSVGKAIAQAWAGASTLGKINMILTGATLAVGVKGFLQMRDMLAKGQDIMANKTAAGGKIPVIYGTRRVGCQVVYMDTAQNRSKDLFVVYALAVGECEEIIGKSIEIDGNSILDGKIYKGGGYIGSDKITSGAGSLNTASQVGDVQYSQAGTIGTDPTKRYSFVFNLHHGAASQTADPMFRASIPNQWSTNHKLNGICYIAAAFDYDKKGMYQGVPQITVQVRGKKVYDPRESGHTFGDTSTYEWSSNPALCYLDYITNDEYGKGLAESDINMSTFESAANACDTLVDQPFYNGSYQNVTWSGTSGDDFITVSDNDDWYQNKVDEVIDIRDNGGTNIFSGVDIKGIKRDEFYDSTQSNKIFIDGTLSSNYTNEAGSFRAKVKRFHCNGYIDTNKNVMDNAKELLANMRGIFTYINGKYELEIEDTGSSTFSITDDHIIGDAGISVDYGSKDKRANKVIVEFFNSQQNYELDTVTVLHNASPNYYSDDGEILEVKAEFPLITDAYIAHNMGKAILTRSRNQTTMQFLGTPEMYKLNVGDIVDLTYAGLGFSGKVCRVEALELQPNGLVSVSLIEYFDVYTWQVPAQEDTRKLLKIPTVGALHPPEANTIVFADTDASNINRPKLTWTEPTDFPVRQYRVDVVDSSDNNVFSKIVDTPSVDLSFLPKASNYEAQITAFNGVGIESEAVTKTFTIADDPVKTTEVEINGVTLSTVESYGTTSGKTGNYVKFTNKVVAEDELFAKHFLEVTGNGALIDSSAGLTVQDGGISSQGLITATVGMQIDSDAPASTTNKLYNVGGTLYWNGNQVGVGAINSVANMANNRVITASGSNSLNGEANFTFDGSTLTVTGDQVITGNLTVQGTTTTIDTTNLDVKDKNITLNYGTGDTSANANGAGITIQDAVSAGNDATILWNTTNDEFDFSHGITLPDNAKATFGTGGDLEIYHDGSNSYIRDLGTGNLRIDATDFYVRNSAGTQLKIGAVDNGAVNLYYAGSKKLETTSTGVAVTGGITAESGSLIIGEDAYSASTNYVGIKTSYMTGTDDYMIISGKSNIDGNTYISARNGSDVLIRGGGNLGSNQIKVPDSSYIEIKTSQLRFTGGLYAGTTEVISSGRNLVNIESIKLNDSKIAYYGTDNDFQIQHTGTYGSIRNYTGTLYITADGTDADIVIQSDDGSGGLATYMYFDGGNTNIKFEKDVYLLDNVDLYLGNSGDLQLLHDTANSHINNYNGDFYITQRADDKDIIFRSDDGSGGFTPYLTLDGSTAESTLHRTTKVVDNFYLGAGNSTDMYLMHDGTNSFIKNNTGNLTIQNNQDDGDIVFKSDDGSGGTHEYFRLDGGNGYILTSKHNQHIDNVKSMYGGSNDLQIYHDGSDSYIKDGGTGDLLIQSNAVRLRATSGENMLRAIEDAQVELYYNNSKKLETTSTGVTVTGYLATSTSGGIFLPDNAKILAGSSNDLQIYHDGSHSYIADVGTGDLIIQAGNDLILNDPNSVEYLRGNQGAGVEVKHNGSTKLLTTSTGIDVTGTTVTDALTVQTAQGNIEIANGSAAIYMKRAGTNYIVASNASGNLRLGSGNNFNRLNIANNGDISFYEDTGTTAKLFWDASAESLGIGTTAPSHKLTVAGTTSHETARVLTTTGNANFRVSTDNSDFAIIGQGGSNRFDIYDNNASATRLSIDSSGNLLVGKTNTTFGNAGIEARENGNFRAIRDGANVGDFNRLTSDGNIVAFYKDNTTVGSIGSDSGTIYIDGGSGSTGLYFGSSNIYPRDNGSTVNNAVDIGHASYKFKDLHLSGTANVGQITVDSRLVIDGSKIYDSLPNGNNKGFGIGGAGFVPTNGSGTNTTNLVDIGTSSYKFKDLWLSGTMNANAISISGTGTTTLGGALNVQGNINTDSGFIQVGGTTVIDDSRNLTNIGTVSSGAITASGTIAYSPTEGNDVVITNDGTYGTSGTGRYVTLGFGGNANGSNRIFAHNTGGDGLYLASATGRHIAFRTNGGSSETFRMTSDGKLQAGSSNTTILDANRNLQNIASITTGAITTSGNLTFSPSGDYYAGLSSTNALHFENGTGQTLMSTASVNIRIDANNSDTNRFFSVSKHSTDVETWRGTELFKVEESGKTTITSSGTIGGSTVANGYLKITDGTNTLGFDTNEVHTTDNLYLNAEDGTIYLRGNNSGAVTLKNGGITFMTTTRDLQNIGNINAGTSLFLGNANKTRISSDNNGEIAINYATTTGTTASSFGIYNNTTRTVTLKRDGSVISSGGTSYLKKLDSPEYRNATIVSDATTPANTAGWFKIAKVDRGAGKILLSFTGGNYSPDTYVIEYFKNWSSVSSLTLKQFGNTSFITKAKIRQDSSDNNYYVEIYCSSNSNGLSFKVYHQRLSGYFHDSNIVYGGSLTAGSTSGTDHVTEKFFEGYGGVTLQEFRADKYQGDINIHNGTLQINTTTVLNSSRALSNIAGITLDNNTSINFPDLSSGDINLGRSGYITLYGDNSSHHSIASRNQAGDAADDITINTYGALYIDLDSNNNNTSQADFRIGRHSANTGTDSYLFNVSGETGNVGVGTASVSNPNGYGKILNVAGYAPALVLSETDTGKDFTIGVNGNELRIFDETTTRVSLSSSGNFGINEAAPSDLLHINKSQNAGTQIQIENQNTGTSSYAGLNLNGQGNNFTIKNWGDGTSKANATEFISTASGSHFIFSTQSTERARIDSSGNFLIGKTSSSTGVAGARFSANGFANVTRDNAECINFNRLTSDGTIIDLRKDSVTVGTIGANAGVMTLASPNGNKHYVSNSALFPSANNILDLGTSSQGYKNLYLSGNANLGSSNYLRFTAATSGSDASVLFGNSAGTGGSLTFKRNSDSAALVTVKADGNLLVGTTSTVVGSATSGKGFRVDGANGIVQAAASGIVSAIFNRTSSDGDIVSLRKNGTQVGSIGVIHGNNLFIGGTNHSGLQFGTSVIYPTGGTGSANDATVDIGATLNRFKDLHLSGTISSGTITSTGNVNCSTVNSTGQIQTGYGIKFDNGATDFLLYNNPNENQLYMRDITNGQMLTTWYTTYFKVNKDLDVTGVIKSNGTTVITSSRNLTNIGTISSGAIHSTGDISTDGDLQVDDNAQIDGILNIGSSTSVYEGAGGDAFFKNTNSGADLFLDSGRRIRFTANGSERARIDASGNFLVGTTSYNNDNAGIGLGASSFFYATRDGNLVGSFNRLTSDGTIIDLRKDSTIKGQIGILSSAASSTIYLASGATSSSGTGLKFVSAAFTDNILPCRGDGSSVDNLIDLGSSSTRFDDIYATNGTIQTSDRNEKQDIQELSDAEQRVATACKGLIRRYKFNSAVEQKGDDARYHFGIIAQDLQDAFEAEGLDAGEYGMFISETWTNDEGQEQTRLGVRYNELLAFIIATL